LLKFEIKKIIVNVKKGMRPRYPNIVANFFFSICIINILVF